MELKKIKNRCFTYTDNSMPWNLNLYLIEGEKYNYIIDTGLGSDSMKHFKKIIETNCLKTKIINTHFHWDHIWGNHEFRDSEIIAHYLCPGLIEKHWDYTLNEYAHFAQGEINKLLPNLLFESELLFLEDQIRLIYTPGHTIDSICVLDEKEKILYIGDNIGDDMQHLIPELDCDKSIYLNSLKKLNLLDFNMILSGHNEITEKDIIVKMIDIIEKNQL